MPKKQLSRHPQPHFFRSNDTKTYLPAFPRVWCVSDEIENHYAKLYDVVVTHYSQQYGWLDWENVGLFSTLLVYARIGKSFVVRDFAKFQKISTNTIAAKLDRLQDCELIDRVMRPDHRGRPVDLVLRPPLGPSALSIGAADRISENILIGKTRVLRRQLGRQFPGVENQFREKQVASAVAASLTEPHTAGALEKLLERLMNVCLTANYRSFQTFFDEQGRPRTTTVTEKERNDYYMREVYRFCGENNVSWTNQMQTAAVEIRRHYGREPFRF